MRKQTEAVRDDLSQLAEDARALMAATADMVGDKVQKARERLAATLDDGKGMCGRVKDETIARVRVANKAMHDHPYAAIATGVGLGALFAWLIGRRW